MSRLKIAFTALIGVFALTGCNARTPAAPSPVKVTNPSPQEVPSVSDAAKEEDERIKREIAKERRKSHSADIDKTNAYRNYIP